MTWQLQLRMRLGHLALDLALEGAAQPAVLLGPNGAGKTTLLRAIAGALRPEAGHIQVGDRRLFDSAAGIDLPPESRRVGFVPQGLGLFPHLRVVDNVAFGHHRPGEARNAGRQRALELLEEMDCVGLARRWPTELSGGEAQRVALARAMMVQPDLLLLDEPLAALDAAARRSLRGYLARRLRRLAIPAIVVTHDPRDVRALDAQVHVIEGGRLVQQGQPAALAEKPATDFVAEFFHTEQPWPTRSGTPPALDSEQ